MEHAGEINVHAGGDVGRWRNVGYRKTDRIDLGSASPWSGLKIRAQDT
jgi:hypothetical protein